MTTSLCASHSRFARGIRLCVTGGIVGGRVPRVQLRRQHELSDPRHRYAGHRRSEAGGTVRGQRPQLATPWTGILIDDNLNNAGHEYVLRDSSW